MAKSIKLEEGQKFNKLTVVKLAYIKHFNYKKTKVDKEFYLCKCDCGNYTVVEKSLIRRKVDAVESCGCAHFKYGSRCNKRIYRIWCTMRKRCYSDKPEYKNYSGRGIRICQEWLDNYKNFENWALKNGYRNDLTIDRINNDGNYEPSNCRWVNMKVQNNNKRNSINIPYNNKIYSLSDLSKLLNISKETLYDRFRKYGICDKLFSKKDLQTGKTLNIL